MNTRKMRYAFRYFCMACSLTSTITLLLIWQIFFKGLSRPSHDDENQRTYCDQSNIRMHYMDDQSPQELFSQDPVRPAFTYELPNGNFCSSIYPHALIFVISKSNNFGSRDAIRRTWGNLAHISSIDKFAHLHLKLIFLIDIDENHLLNIKLEQSIYNDLVQVRLPQHYTLSTYRDMAILHWTDTYCPQAMLTIKTDDDIFLNTFLLANVLHKIIHNSTFHPSKTECKYADMFDPLAIIYGIKIQEAIVVRTSNDPVLEGTRYIVTDDEYPCTYYPDYMSGFGYIVNKKARAKLLCAFFRQEKSFHLSDVYITGVLAEYMDIQRQNLGLKISYRSTDDCEKFFNQYNAYACASSSHYRDKQLAGVKDVYIFERFNTYWKRVYQNRVRFYNKR